LMSKTIKVEKNSKYILKLTSFLKSESHLKPLIVFKSLNSNSFPFRKYCDLFTKRAVILFQIFFYCCH
jgi:hypothetical protein